MYNICSTCLLYTSLRSYSADVRIDMRDVRYEDAISDVVKWWESMPEYTPMGVPDECISPVYSTWYSFHQMVDAEEIEKAVSYTHLDVYKRQPSISLPRHLPIPLPKCLTKSKYLR